MSPSVGTMGWGEAVTQLPQASHYPGVQTFDLIFQKTQ